MELYKTTTKALFPSKGKGHDHDDDDDKVTTAEKTHVESTRAMTHEHGSHAESLNHEILLFLTADRRFDRKVKFPTVQSLTEVKCRGGGGDGRFWN